MKKFLGILFCLLTIDSALAGISFDEWFFDKTLRIDYAFVGSKGEQTIAVDELLCSHNWHGRRTNLDSLFQAGNGQITVTDEESGRVLYRTSFSSLFQEWQGTEEATRTLRSFENVFLLPCPKRAAQLTVSLMNSRHETVATLTHRFDPQDILIRKTDEQTVAHTFYTHQSGDSKEKIDIAIIAEGYTADEMNVFQKDAIAATESLLTSAAFAPYKNRFNIVAVCLPSASSGVSVPKTGEWRATALGSHFSTFYSDRYLTTLRLKQLHNCLAGIPYEHIIILANTDTYGGGGIFNSYTLTTTHNPQFLPVVVHEFGHSFAGLADEYFYDDEYEPMYPPGIEPWEKNITTLTDFAAKWQSLLPKGTPVPTPPNRKKSDIYTRVGVFEGGGYQSKGVYRPCEECRMKINAAPDFCPVCTKIIGDLIRYYTE